MNIGHQNQNCNESNEKNKEEDKESLSVAKDERRM